MDFAPWYKLTPNRLTLFERPIDRVVSDKEKETWNNLGDNSNRYNEISEMSAKRLKDRLELMIFITKEKIIKGRRIESVKISEVIEKSKKEAYETAIKYKLTMITLTLSAVQVHTDEEIKRHLLNDFLTQISKKYNIELYVWKAEKQENGNIHFHIIIDRYIHHAEVRALWNRIQNKKKFEYVDRYRESQIEKYKNGFMIDRNSKIEENVQLLRYEKAKSEDFRNPNSTDIHSLRSVRNTASYLTKYLVKGVTKNDRMLRIDIIRKNIDSVQKAKLKITASASVLTKNETKEKKANLMLSNFNQQIEKLTVELNELLNQGVSGRIYGLSRKLSKLTHVTDMQTVHNVPHINEIAEAETYHSTLQIMNKSVKTFFYNIERCPNLKKEIFSHYIEQWSDSEIK